MWTALYWVVISFLRPLLIKLVNKIIIGVFCFDYM